MPDPSQIPPIDFRQVFETAPGAFLILSPDLVIVAASDAYLSATLTRRDSIVDRPLFEAFPDDPRDPAADGTRNLRASLNRVRERLRPDSMPVQHYPIRRPDGTFESRYWKPSNHPVLDDRGHLTLIIHHVEDVTRQRAAEKGLEALALAPDSALPTFFEALFEGVQIIDFEGRYAYINEAAAAHGQRVRSELLGQRMVDCYPGIDQSEFYPHLERCLTLRKAAQLRNHFEYPDGKSSWFELRIMPVPMGAVIFSADISQQLKLEELLRSSERLDTIGRLAGGIAHDFNNLVMVIRGYSALLQEELPAGSPHQEPVATILDASERAGDLTRQLLAFGRRQLLEPRVLHLNQSLHSVVKLLRRLIGANINVELKTLASPDLVHVDPSQLEQVIMNLALNARDAMPDGGKLTLETSTVLLDQDFLAQHPDAQAGRHVLLAATDTGHGMDADTLTRVFEPFFTTKQMGHGTGLGLATVYGIVRQSSGTIWVYSEPGRGSCFKVYLPLHGAAEGVAELQSALPTPKAPRVGLCVLLVEDDPAVRGYTETVLKKSGFQVLGAADGPTALRLCGDHAGAIDLLLSDVILPDLGGPDLAVQVKALRPGIKVLFMSGYTDNAIAHQGVLDADIPFVSKPVTPAVLLRKIAALWGEA